MKKSLLRFIPLKVLQYIDSKVHTYLVFRIPVTLTDYSAQEMEELAASNLKHIIEKALKNNQLWRKDWGSMKEAFEKYIKENS